MEYLIRFSQSHETFRVAEIQALAIVAGFNMEIIHYDAESPFCVVRLPSEEAARTLIKRSIIAQSIHEHWGTGGTFDELHAEVKKKTSELWPKYKTASFKISLDNYQGTRPNKQRVALFNSFSYLPFSGEIKMKDPDEEFTIFEQWDFKAVERNLPAPLKVHFGRYIAPSGRDLCLKFDLKKRGYISTTSMDSELALITANIALAAPGKLFYDPFVGTGSFPIACAQWGALAFGSDIDGRSIRGEGKKKSLKGNFEQYGLQQMLGDMFVCDLTNSPVRRRRILDGILCDPPYGVREGLKVLGCRDPEKEPWVVEKGKLIYKEPDFIPPKKPYSFLAMLDDILQFATDTLVDNGRLSFWMPTANDEQQEMGVPTHPCMENVVVCTQVFNKWTRRLITYRRLPDSEVDSEALAQKRSHVPTNGVTADELNPFRRHYFNGFRAQAAVDSAIEAAPK
ncbi:S-adenosyl-L-methionine-dependent methyltransferase [Pseudomassariella vexata]|uniref:tRNA (guanine(10)-N(2))-methyltransferase n=1 Tax=Pseudomassariella vexata TaxID=1141098 RepID=A0A1Y2DSX2_9PEZI|nr:S-adenosyl-L-methionine-dependent methyltransferase [Pseudomassariella vexata]ORY62373.1 S-adenosyl-L-methionine-dependent methyltransferase [Pseudomassariella vexata]